eukprot:Tbor_TRINITY_DN3601_c0_g1::TRINITY_DN3601_c0_g1_i1::g.424::m.424/K14779/DDX52, ROK1; ATP-dependent RNA helicase DDX52/ROK1
MTSKIDTFVSLSSGATFEKPKHGKEMKLFKEGTIQQQVIGGVHAALDASSTASTTTQQEEKKWAFDTPLPPLTLNLFGFGHDDRTKSNAEDDEEEIDEGVTKGAVKSDDAPLKPMTRKKMLNIWKKNSISVVGKNVAPPITHFSDLVRPPLNVPHNIVNNIFARKIKQPTPTQMQAIPTLIQGRSVLACAPTGSGKTLAYLLPLFARLKAPNPEAGGIRAMIVAPTMELAVQIERETLIMLKGARWKLVQHGQTTKNKDIFVTTPARVVNMVKENLIDLQFVEYLVFDEGDKLLDVSTSFISMVKEIITACTNINKVVCLFTATLSKKIEQVAISVMPDEPVRIIVNDRTASSKDVNQKLVFTGSEEGKIIALRNIIKEGFQPPMLIFLQSIDRTKELYDEVNCAGLHCAIINSKMTSAQRDEVVLNFRLGNIWVLITTELLARGIDFKNVGTVVNYDFPISKESYVHRVGRTGRAGKQGNAITFFTEDDKNRLPMIVQIVKDSGSPVEEWMLKLKISKTKQRMLERETPHRTIISTQKKQMIRKKQNERELRSMKRERELAGKGDDDSDLEEDNYTPDE